MPSRTGKRADLSVQFQRSRVAMAGMVIAAAASVAKSTKAARLEKVGIFSIDMRVSATIEKGTELHIIIRN